MQAQKTVDLVGKLCTVTDHALLWHCTVPQIDTAAYPVVTHKLWFPKLWVQRRQLGDGRTVLTVPASVLAQRIATLPKSRALAPRWEEKEEEIA